MYFSITVSNISIPSSFLIMVFPWPLIPLYGGFSDEISKAHLASFFK